MLLSKLSWISGKGLTSTQNNFCLKRNLNLVQLKTCYQTEREPTQKQVLPFSVETFEISPNLLNAPKTLKDLVNPYKNKKELIELQGQKEITNKNSKFGSFFKRFLVDILLFSAALVTMIIMLVVIYMVCRQSKLKTLVANIALQHVKEIEAADTTDRYCMCKTNWYITGMLLIMMIGIFYLVTKKSESLVCFKEDCFLM